MKLRLYMLLFMIVCLWSAEAQVRRDAVRQDEMVSLKNDITYGQALMSLSEMSKRFVNKPIIDPAPLDNAPIGVNIESKHWLEALRIILSANGRAYREEPDYFLVIIPRAERSGVVSAQGAQAGQAVQAGQAEQGATPGKPVVNADTREVMITTVFFSLDVDKSQSFGLDWSFSFLKGRDSVVGDFAAPGRAATLDLRYARPYRYGDILTSIQLFSQSGFGEIIASPRLIVRSEDEGRFQVGQDISVVKRDIQPGGVISTSVQTLPTGTIVTVTPVVMKEGNLDFVFLTLNIDRSNAITTGELPTIDRTSAKTSLLLVDGEEVFIGGLYFNEESITRTGIPFLKDLPWWVFGLRYVFGSDDRRMIRRELAILIKADIMPTLRERAAQKVRESALETQRKKFEQDLERLKTKKDEKE